jgi:hypothetical protein
MRDDKIITEKTYTFITSNLKINFNKSDISGQHSTLHKVSIWTDRCQN